MAMPKLFHEGQNQTNSIEVQDNCVLGHCGVLPVNSMLWALVITQKLNSLKA